jgi:hypothetical protein
VTHLHIWFIYLYYFRQYVWLFYALGSSNESINKDIKEQIIHPYSFNRFLWIIKRKSLSNLLSHSAKNTESTVVVDKSHSFVRSASRLITPVRCGRTDDLFSFYFHSQTPYWNRQTKKCLLDDRAMPGRVILFRKWNLTSNLVHHSASKMKQTSLP